MALAGCSDSHDKVTADTLDIMADMNDVLDGVTDKASAEAAKPKLEAIGERMKDVKARADKLGEPSAEQQEQLKAKYEERMGKEMMRMFGNAMRVGTNPEIAVVLEDAMQGIEPPSMGPGGMPGGGMELEGEAPEMGSPFESNDGDFGSENPFGSDSDGPGLPADPQPAADDQPE
jgi:hypothetical protein